MRGFSLLELSIVLVIIGLLAGGVMVGQDLMKQSELRSIVSDLNQIATAVNGFKSKYNAVPGDMRNAESYWGTAAGGCPLGSRTGSQTCNGNGNSLLYWDEIDATSPEIWTAWQHLSSAGLYEGSFTGLSVSTTTEFARPGVNIPESKIAGVGYLLLSVSQSTTTSPIWWYAQSPLTVIVGAESANDVNYGPAFSPQDAGVMDTKMDDGKPGTGIFRTFKQAGCVVGVTPTMPQAVATYDLTQNTKTCTINYSLSGTPGSM